MQGLRSLRTRQFRLLMVYAVCSLPLIVYGAVQAMQTNANSPLDWVPEDFPPRAVYAQSVAKFGAGDVVVASWPGCTIGAQQLDELMRKLRDDRSFRSRTGQRYFERVTSGRELAAALTGGPRPISRDDAVRRLEGSFVGPDGLQTCVVIGFTAAALKHRGELVNRIQACIQQVCRVSRAEQHLAGPVIDGLSVDRAGRASLDQLAVPSAVLVTVLACVCLGSLRAGLTVAGLSLFCQAMTLALVHFSGQSMSALLSVLPPLVQVLAVAGGVHLTSYYFDSLEHHGPRDAAREAVRQGWLPCLLSAGTTALGTGSLISSRLSPIRSFGMFASAGVVLTAALLLLMVPAVWAEWPPQGTRCHQESDHRRWTFRNRLAFGLSRLVSRFHNWILVAAVLVMAVSGWLLQDLRTSVRIQTLFPAGSRILRDCHWIEKHVGPLVPVDLIVSWPADSTYPLPSRMQKLWEIQQKIDGLQETGRSLSAVQFVPAVPSRNQLPPEVFRRTVLQLLESSRSAFADAGLLAVRGDREYWRITARLSALSTVDYSRFLNRLTAVVTPGISVEDRQAGIQVEYTGIMPLVHEIQRQLMRDLLCSFLGALVLITAMMTLSQGGVVAGLLAMMPNLFPLLLLFGTLGFGEVPLDIGTVMTASVALGVSVDDTLHFLTFFQKGLLSGQSRREAVHFALRHCGTAMIQTSLICGLGLLVFGLADFIPTSRFAWMTASLIAAALLADLVLLPSLLLSPLGSWFHPGAPAAAADEL